MVVQDSGLERSQHGSESKFVPMLIAALVIGSAVAIPLLARASGAGDTTEDSARVSGETRIADRLDSTDFDAMQKALSSQIPESMGADFMRQGVDENGMPSESAAEAPPAGYVATNIRNGQEWKLFVASPSNVGDVGSCESGEESMAVSCTEAKTPWGLERVELLLARSLPSAGPGKFAVVRAADITKDMLPSLRVERVVRLFPDGGGMLSARQTVYGIADFDFAAALEPTSTLEGVVQDESLIASLTQ